MRWAGGWLWGKTLRSSTGTLRQSHVSHPFIRLTIPLSAVRRASRVNSRPEIGSVVISSFHRTPPGSGLMKQPATTPPPPEDFPHPFRTLVSSDLQTMGDEYGRAMTAVESAPETDEEAG